jgi:hypothetical protein
MNVDRALSQPPMPMLSTETTTSHSRSEPIASMTRRRPFSAHDSGPHPAAECETPAPVSLRRPQGDFSCQENLRQRYAASLLMMSFAVLHDDGKSVRLCCVDLTT